ncbi:MAG: ATP synthase F1 subunit delta [Planctomycetota bacterium]|nr:ATP synthase F1 subunit delta [Planctomycetota bacterium]
MSSEKLTTPRLFKKLPTYDSSEIRAAKVYATAIVSAAEQAGKTEQVLAEFKSLIEDVLDPLPKLDAILSSALIAQDVKIQLLDKALRGKASPLLLNSLKVIAQHDRLGMLRVVAVAMVVAVERLRNRVHVLASSAVPLRPESEQRIIAEIRLRMGCEPVLEKQVNPDLIGGVVLRVGDRVFDGSVATQFKRIREQMIQRSVHEIQSRRNRFSTSEGN